MKHTVPELIIRSCIAFIVTLLPELGCADAVPFLYKIQGTKTSYLMGTIHAGVQLLNYPMNITQLIARSEVLMTEKAPSLEQINKWEQDFNGLITDSMRSKPTPKNPLDTATFNAYLRYGVPRVIAEKISDDDCEALGALYEIVLSKPLPLDFEIVKIGLKNGLRSVALDNEDLIRKSLSSKNCSLKETFKDQSPEELRNQVLADVQNAILDFKSGKEPMVNSEEPLLKVRNLAWIDSIVNQIENNKTFIAVGADHLFGETGLIRLLKARGYVVNRVWDKTKD